MPTFRRLFPRTVAGTLLLGLAALVGMQVVAEFLTFHERLNNAREREFAINREMARAVATAFDGYVSHLLRQQHALLLDFTSSLQHEEAVKHFAVIEAESPAIRRLIRLKHGGWGDLAARDRAALGPVLGELSAGHEVVVSNLLPIPSEDEPSFVVARSLIAPSGRREMLLALVDPARLDPVLALRREGQAALTLLDANGRVVVRRPRFRVDWATRDWTPRLPGLARVLAGEEVQNRVRSPADGLTRLVSAVPVPRTGWAVAASTVEREVLAPVWKGLVRGLARTLGLVTIGVIVALLLARRLTLPLERLRNEVRAFGRGEPSRHEEVDAPVELVVLGRAFARMTEELAARQSALQEQTRKAEEAAAEARRREVLLAAVLENMPEGVFFAEGPDASIYLANRAARDLIGRPIPSGCAIDLHAEEFGLRKPDGSPYTASELPLTRALHGETVTRQEVVVRRADGSDATLMVNSAVLPEDGGPPHAIAVFQDITPLKEAARRREEMLRLLSHDMRSPLGAIMMNAELARSLLKPPDGAPSRAVDRILSSTRRLNALVNDILDSARAESGSLQLQREPVSLPLLVNDTLEAYFIESARRRVSVQVVGVAADCADGPPRLQADRLRLERVIANLVGNALKYSPVDSPVVVRIDCDGEEQTVSVEDRGAGISPEDLARVFDRYFRAGATRAMEGLGLGLYITRVLVEAHGGRIWAESREGAGSTFHLVLPALAAEPARMASA